MGSERPERKLAAIFCADVAGYSRLTGQDEEGTHRILSARLDGLTAAIERHGGKVLHYAGDAVLADFPNVVDALSCGVDVQRAKRTACPRSAGRNFASASIWVTSSLDTGATFRGPQVCRQALAEGQQVLDRGCVSHNYFWFYRDAMEVTDGLAVAD